MASTGRNALALLGGLGLFACSAPGSPGTAASSVKQKDDTTLVQIVLPLRGGVVEYADASTIALPEEPVVVDLLRLQSQAAALGLHDLPAGTLARIRLTLDDASAPYAITSEGTQVPLDVPSGELQI